MLNIFFASFQTRRRLKLFSTCFTFKWRHRSWKKKRNWFGLSKRCKADWTPLQSLFFWIFSGFFRYKLDPLLLLCSGGNYFDVPPGRPSSRFVLRWIVKRWKLQWKSSKHSKSQKKNWAKQLEFQGKNWEKWRNKWRTQFVFVGGFLVGEKVFFCLGRWWLWSNSGWGFRVEDKLDMFVWRSLGWIAQDQSVQKMVDDPIYSIL